MFSRSYHGGMRSGWAEVFWSILTTVVTVIAMTAYIVWTLRTPGFGAPGFVALGALLLMGFVLKGQFDHARMSKPLPPWFVTMVFHRVEIELQHIEACREEVESMLHTEVRRLEQRLHSEADRMEEDERLELYEHHEDTHWELSAVFPRLIRNSMFVTTYTFLEWGLLQLCAVLAQIRPSAISVKDLQGRPIEQARAYIAKVQGIAFPADTAEWQAIAIYRQIRNVIVHRNAIVTKGDNVIRQFIEKNPAFAAINQHGHLTIHSEGCRNTTNTIRAFFKLVFGRAFDHVKPPSK